MLEPERRHRSFLQRVYGGVDRRPNPLHRLFPKKRRRIQQCVQECQTRPYCRRYRICMDVGRHSGLFISRAPPRVTSISHSFFVLISYNPVPSRINTVFLARGGTVLARRSKFCFSPRSGPHYFHVSCDAKNLTQIRANPASSPQNLNLMPHTLTPGSRSLVLVGESSPTAFSSSSGEFYLGNGFSF